MINFGNSITVSLETRKVRAKSLKRISNSLLVEINELKTQGLSNTEDLEKALGEIRKFCDKLSQGSNGTVRNRLQSAMHGTTTSIYSRHDVI